MVIFKYPKRSAHPYAPLYAAFDWYVPPKTHVKDNDEVEFKISPGEITTAIKAGLEANTQVRFYIGSPMEAKQLAIDLKDRIKSKSI